MNLFLHEPNKVMRAHVCKVRRVPFPQVCQLWTHLSSYNIFNTQMMFTRARMSESGCPVSMMRKEISVSYQRINRNILWPLEYI